MAPAVLHLLRHGAPRRPGLLLGRTDEAPTPAGIRACVDRVQGLAVDALVSSDLARAARAAAAIGRRLSLPVGLDPRWRELDFGDWDGLAPGEVDQAALGRFWQDPDGHPPPRGERWAALVARIAAALADLTAREALVVTHGGAIRAALAHLCALEQRHTWALGLPYAALISLRIWPESPASAQIIGLRG